MRLHALVLLALTVSVALAPLSADEPPASESSASELSRVVGSVYGKSITAADIGLTAPIDTSLKFDARDTQQWQLMGRIVTAFGKPIGDHFVAEHKLDATRDEITAFKMSSLAHRRKHLRETESQREKLKAELVSPNLSSEARTKLEAERAMLDRLLPMLQSAVGNDIPDNLARMFIVTQKTERELKKVYGGRVIFQQAGVEALDARRRLYEEAEKNGDLKFEDAGVRHLFYYYSNMSHSVIDERALSRTPPAPTTQKAHAQIQPHAPETAIHPNPPQSEIRAKAPRVENAWVIAESAAEPMEFTPQQIVPVESGVWFGGRQPGSAASPLGFMDLNEGRVTLLLANGSTSWDAVGSEALAIQLDRRSLVRLSATERNAATSDQRPKGCDYFSQVVAHRDHFYISSPYNPLWVFDPRLRTWQKIELELVTDSDSEKLGPSYYRPSMNRFVIGPGGDLWGFQGTRDASRGNAVCHYVSGQTKWEQHGFPWATARGDDHWPIGETDTAVWFAGRNDLLRFDKGSHRWTTTHSIWREGGYGSAKFTPFGVLIPVGDTVKRLADDFAAWDDVATLGNDERITAIAAAGDSLYLATASGIYVLERIDVNRFGKPRLYPWKFADGAKTYQAVHGLASQDPALALADQLCKASAQGNLERVRALLAEGANTEATTDPSGSTPLMLACFAGHQNVAEFLIERGADLQAKNSSRQNSLTMAAQGGHRELADYLMSQGATR